MKAIILKIALCVGFAITFLGCSSDIGNEIVYEMSQPHCSIKHNQTLSELELCQAQAKKRISYEQYKKERKEVIENKH